jgi:hypothetical protein
MLNFGWKRGRPEAAMFNFECWILDDEWKRGRSRRMMNG